MRKTAEQQQIFEVVYRWVLTEVLEDEKSQTEVLQSCRQSISILKDFVEDSELDKDVVLIENILPEVVNSVVKKE